jgi:hypothetical protein
MKVGKKGNLSIFLATYHKNLGIFFFFFFNFQNLANLGHFLPMKNPLYRLKSSYSGRNLMKFHPQKKKAEN